MRRHCVCEKKKQVFQADVLATMSIFGVRRAEENNEVNLVTVFIGRLKLEDPSGINTGPLHKHTTGCNDAMM